MKEVFLCTFFAKKLHCKRPTFKQPTTPRKKERILRILRMISSSHLLSGSFIVSSTPPRGGRNVSSSNSISSNNNNNNNNSGGSSNNNNNRRRAPEVEEARSRLSRTIGKDQGYSSKNNIENGASSSSMTASLLSNDRLV